MCECFFVLIVDTLLFTERYLLLIEHRFFVPQIVGISMTMSRCGIVGHWHGSMMMKNWDGIGDTYRGFPRIGDTEEKIRLA